jgi:CheY-like chemotaxis protein
MAVATILVAESDATTLELIETVLTRDGFRVLAIGDHASALAKVRQDKPELAVLAESLAGGATAELCRVIKREAAATRTIVIMSDGAAADRSAVKDELGCDAVMPGPFRYGVLKEILSDLGLLGAPASDAPSFSFGVPIPEPVGFDLAVLAPAPPELDGVMSLAPMTPMPLEPAAGESWAATPIPIPLNLQPSAGAAAPLPQVTPVAPVETQELMLDDIVANEPAAATPAQALRIEMPAPSQGLRIEVPAAALRAPAPAAPAVVPAAAAPPVAAPIRETRPGSPLPPSLPPQGELSAMPVPRIVFELYLASFTGVVQLTRQGLKRAIYCRGGLPVRVDSNQVDETLGRLLVQHGRITDEQYAHALEHAATKNKSDGDALVELGTISSSELLDALRELTEQRLVNSFAWRDGSFRIDSDASFTDKSLLSEVHPLRSIWRGVREHYDLVSLMTYFAALRAHYAVATELFSVHFDTLGSFLRELDMATLLDGKTTFEAALRSDDSRAMEIAQAIYVLLVCDMVRPSTKPGAAAVLPQKVEAQRAATAPTDYREVTRICDEVAREYIRVKESDYFEALRVEPDSSVEDVEAAYYNVVKPYIPEMMPAGLPDDVVRRAKEICEILARAKSVLRDPAQKERYIAAQRQKFAVSEAAEAEQRKQSGAPPPGGPRDLMLDIDEEVEKVREQRLVSEKAFNEGLRYMKGGNPSMARQKFEIAIRLNDREPTYRTALAQAFIALAPVDRAAQRHAVACLQQALQLDPSQVEANFEMAKLVAGAGQNDAAKVHLQRVLQRSPEHKEGRALLKKLGG